MICISNVFFINNPNPDPDRNLRPRKDPDPKKSFWIHNTAIKNKYKEEMDAKFKYATLIKSIPF
jgi:hypothetical protein